VQESAQCLSLGAMPHGITTILLDELAGSCQVGGKGAGAVPCHITSLLCTRTPVAVVLWPPCSCCTPKFDTHFYPSRSAVQSQMPSLLGFQQTCTYEHKLSASWRLCRGCRGDGRGYTPVWAHVPW
jgi:hypothetical protein